MAAAPDLSATLRQAPARPSRLKVCLVTCFPPSLGDLNEYGFHLASALREHDDVELLILADETQVDGEPPDFRVERCWRFNSVLTPARLLAAIRNANPDVVWFNMGFSTFAREPLPAFLSIAGPALSRISGFYTHVTLHTIFERINLRDAGVRMPLLYRTAGRIATHMLLRANDVTVLLPSFRSEILKNYRVHTDRVHFRPHGTFSAGRPPDRLIGTGTGTDAEKAALAFGYWGTYKRLELLLDSWANINRELPNAKLLIAGIDHPSTPGYLESLKPNYGANGNIKFLGYVPESDLPKLFCAASLLVLPYSSAAGTSGVVHQACEYGLPMVAADIPEIRELAREYGVAAEFYSSEDGSALRTHIVRILKSDELRCKMALQNSNAGKKMQMSQVVGDYLSLFKTRTCGFRHTRYTVESQNSLAQTVGDWLLHSGIEESNGGIARYHTPEEHRNKPVSTEITGYCASALVFLYQRTADIRYLDSALRKAQFLAHDAWDANALAMPFECESKPQLSYFFDTGIIVRGLLAVWRKRPDSHLLAIAMKCGESMYRDFYDGEDYYPILSLPDKKPLTRDRARWSRSSGCYQLKAALAWHELWQATADEQYRTWYQNLLHSCLASHLSFLPGSENEDLVMDRLHAYSYFLEGILPAISNPACQEAMRVGIDRVRYYAEQIGPQFLRSDVLAQLLRIRIFSDRSGVAPLNHEAAAREAALIREFQSHDSDVRLNGGFWFSRKQAKIQPFMNPVSTVFCYQALEMWEQFQQGSSDFYWQDLI